MKPQKNIAIQRFAACMQRPRLLIFLLEAARRAAAGGLFLNFNFSAGCHFRDEFTPLMNVNNLTRHEIFRGKVSRRKNQNPNRPSKKGRVSAKNP